MKRILLLLFFLIVFAIEVGATCVYVSSSTGSDSNKGNTPTTAYETIAEALLCHADTVKLKCGDVFYESFRLFDSSVDNYGEGALPVISGYRRLVEPKWISVGYNVWMLSLIDKNFTGFQVLGSSLLNNIGNIHEYDKDLIHGNRKEHLSDLNSNWDFWQNEGHSKSLPASVFDNLYLYLEKNPNELSLEFSVNDCGVYLYGRNINGVKVTGFNTGINVFINGDITNCRIDAMGGNLFLTSSSEFVCAGNGIQYWVGNFAINKSKVEGCYITRCYDCGITIQGSCDGGLSPHNVTVSNNLIAFCCQGWEDFLHHKDAHYDNCVFENNVVVFSGDSGFGYPKNRFKLCHVVQNNNYGLKGMVFRDNIFIGGNFYCSSAPAKDAYNSAKWIDNIVYLQKGDYIMGNYEGTKDVERIPAGFGVKYSKAKDEAIAIYRRKVQDNSTRFIVVSESKVNRLGKRAINQYLKTHNY